MFYRGYFILKGNMIPSVYVMRNSNQKIFCVSKVHYELYKNDYTLVNIKEPDKVLPEVEEVATESLIEEAPKVGEVPKTIKKGRPYKKKG